MEHDNPITSNRRFEMNVHPYYAILIDCPVFAFDLNY
jgi:hypothetical protein